VAASAQRGTAASPGQAVLAAAWDDAAGRHHVGLLAAGPQGPRRLASLEVPSRAHGMLAEAGGSLLFVARRPGEWLLRWPADRRRPQWLWNEPDRCFTGHVQDQPGWPGLVSVETDLDSGQGLIVVRERRTLQRLAEWPTSGIDPHQLLAEADGTLLLANGGIPTRPETGRMKLDLDRMDPSLVRLDPRDGRLLGQWRLDDARLSIRHLARHSNGTVGIALQAEHDDAAARTRAPVLALFDGQALHPIAAPLPLAGYGGDIAATADGFAVSVPRASGSSRTADAQGLWAGGRDGWAARSTRGSPPAGWDALATWPASAVDGKKRTALRLDNHCVVVKLAR
jgi:hypothetical protein